MLKFYYRFITNMRKLNSNVLVRAEIAPSIFLEEYSGFYL